MPEDLFIAHIRKYLEPEQNGRDTQAIVKTYCLAIYP